MLAYRKKPAFFAFLGLVLILLILLGGGWFLLRRPSIIYVTQKIEKGPLKKEVVATGTVNPTTLIQVGSYVSGVIQERLCDYNTRVSQGQVCARIDPRPYQIIVDQSRANLKVAQAQVKKDQVALDYAKVTFERNEKLLVRQVISQDAFDTSRSTYEQAQAQVDLDEANQSVRQAELTAAEINLSYTEIVSPVEGTVVSRNIERGQTVAANFQTPMLFLVATDLMHMQVDTNISESDVGVLREGLPVNFTVESFPDRIFKGQVTQIRQSPQTIQNVVTYDAVISADNSEGLLKPGMTATVSIILDQRESVIKIPNQALRYRPNTRRAAEILPKESHKARVWKLDHGSQKGAQPVEVTLGLDDGLFTEMVTGDLQSGDEVIVGESQTRGETRPMRGPSLRF